MASILVADGEQRSALAVVRSLGRAGHTVFVASPARSPLAGASRYARGTVVVPSPLKEPRHFVEAIRDAVIKRNIDLLLPVTEGSLLALLPERDRIPARLPFPSAEAFARLCDKQAVVAEARALGIAVPKTIRVECVEDAGLATRRDLTYPLVVKPLRSIGTSNGTRSKQQVMHVADAATLEAKLRRLPEDAFPLLLQERITGPGVGVFVLLQGGEVRAAFAHRRIREKPVTGGVSVYCESIALDPRLLERSVALLRRFDFEGAGMVEYKCDQRTNEPYIMEINGRFWGSLQLAIDAGVDFPALLVSAAMGKPAPPVMDFRRGVRSRWWWGDVDHLLLRWRAAAESSDRPVAERLRAVRDFTSAFWSGSRNEVFRIRDPLPAVRESIQWVRALGGN